MIHNQPQMRIKRFGNVLPVRLSEQVDSKLKKIAKAAGITKSDALRMAINNGLPELEAGRININEHREVAA